jgi:hypothetical protein
MTAPWLVRRSKTDELEGLVALLAVGLHFVVATALALAAVYGVQRFVPCYLISCMVVGVGQAVAVFLAFDVLVFLAAWGLTVILATKGWWRVAPPLVGIVITAIPAAVVLWWVFLGIW